MSEVILATESGTGRHRVRAERVSPAVFRVTVERLFDAVDAGGVKRGEFWSAVLGVTSYTDTAERAAELAADALRAAEAAAT